MRRAQRDILVRLHCQHTAGNESLGGIRGGFGRRLGEQRHHARYSQRRRHQEQHHEGPERRQWRRVRDSPHDVAGLPVAPPCAAQAICRAIIARPVAVFTSRRYAVICSIHAVTCCSLIVNDSPWGGRTTRTPPCVGSSPSCDRCPSWSSTATFQRGIVTIL